MLDYNRELKDLENKVDDLEVLLGQKEDELVETKSERDDLIVEREEVITERDNLTLQVNSLTIEKDGLASQLEESRCKNLQFMEILNEFQTNAIVRENQRLRQQKELLEQIVDRYQLLEIFPA